jgi:3-dehydroquinate dehydratase/shikimate dehydrogenase
MSLIGVSIAVSDPESVADALHGAQVASLHDADVVEWRLEGLAGKEGGAEAARELVARSPMPCIATVRSAKEGGDSECDEGDLAELMSLMTPSPPTYVDLELATWSGGGPRVEAVRRLIAAGSRLIISTHDFNGRPTDLARRIEAISNIEEAAISKVVWMARSVGDLAEVAEVLRNRRRPMIALCMGEMGVASRIVAPVLGGFLTFATTGEGEETAPGQQSIDTLIDLYRFRSLRVSTKIYGIIGWPVHHSLSPAIHNAGFTAAGFDGVYVPLPVRESFEHFKAAMALLVGDPTVPFLGGSVTMPHKAHLVRWVRERGGDVCQLSGAIDAANTLVVGEDGGVSCLNTDGPAVVSLVRKHVGREDLAGVAVTVIGAGGMARSAAGALLGSGAEVRVVNRTRDRAEDLAKMIDAAMGGRIEVGSMESAWSGTPAVVVQATSMGMADGPDPEGAGIPTIPDGIGKPLLIETVSSPQQTPLVQQATDFGWPVVTGDQVLLEQAMAQFAAWTGCEPPRESMEEALRLAMVWR